MKKLHKDLIAIGGIILAMIFLPIFGTVINFKGNVPVNFYEFPPLSPDAKAPFNIIVFIVIAVVCLFIVLLYLFPNWFGFKKINIDDIKENREKVKLPAWFWFGIVIFFVALYFLWSKSSEPKFIINWLLIPLFWGVIFIVDGFVYIRTAGRSLIGKRPQTIIAIAVCSMGGWLLFEYLNFFVRKNWYYPAGDLILNEQFLIYSIIGSSALLTVVFEWYMLLKSFKKFAIRYTQGPKIKITKPIWRVVLMISLAAFFVIPFFPNQLFFLIWVAPMTALLSILSLRGKWTPLKPIEKGNWSLVALICLSYFIQGLLYECWNYFGGYHLANGELQTFNPGYWVYSVPYVDKFHIFEMPALGLFGYLPFGLYCWAAWLAFANLLGINPQIDDEISD